MATFKSEQLVQFEANRPSQHKRDAGSKVRSETFTWVGAAGVLANDIVRLGTLKKGWRLQGMRAVAPATFLAATGTIELGVTGVTAQYLGATDAAAALSADANHTAALLYGKVLAADEELIATIKTAGGGAEIDGPLVVTVRYTR